MNNNSLLAITGAFYSGGGIAAVNRLNIRSLLEEGYHVRVFSLNETIAHQENLQQNLIYHTFSGSKRRFVQAIWQELIREKPSLVLCDHINPAAALAPMAILRRQRYLVWVYGTEVFSPRPDIEGKIGLHWAWKCLACSDYTHRIVKEKYPKIDITTIEPALDPERYGISLPEVPDQPGKQLYLESVRGSTQPLGEKVILHVSRMETIERYKGHRELLQAFPRIQGEFPDTQLVFVGDGNDRSYLISIAKTQPEELQSHIFMPGYVQSDLLNELYNRCYLFTMPSWGEGYGIVFLEAMSHAKACLGGRVDATPCAIQEGVTGILVDDPKSPEQLGEKIIWMLQRPEQVKKMGLAGYERVRSNYLFPHYRDRFLKAIAG